MDAKQTQRGRKGQDCLLQVKKPGFKSSHGEIFYKILSSWNFLVERPLNEKASMKPGTKNSISLKMIKHLFLL